MTGRDSCYSVGKDSRQFAHWPTILSSSISSPATAITAADCRGQPGRAAGSGAISATGRAEE
jgi:hypothetical protein